MTAQQSIPNSTATVAQAVEAMSAKAYSGCGQSYELFTRTFSRMFDAAWPPGHPDREQAISESGGLYMTPAEHAAEMQALKLNNEGMCQHFFDLGCCPLGCGEEP